MDVTADSIAEKKEEKKEEKIDGPSENEKLSMETDIQQQKSDKFAKSEIIEDAPGASQQAVDDSNAQPTDAPSTTPDNPADVEEVKLTIAESELNSEDVLRASDSSTPSSMSSSSPPPPPLPTSSPPPLD